MPKTGRKVTCPRCHRSILESELAQHLRQHKGKTPSVARVERLTKGSKTAFPCFYCDLRFGTRDQVREHMRNCSLNVEVGQQCSVCSVVSEVLLPFSSLMVCPKCSVGYFPSTTAFGCPLINHMDDDYEEIFRKKSEVLLNRLKVEKLSELGISVVMITFSQGMDAFRHSISPRGELVFMFANTNQIREQEKRVFENVISHEIFHGYVTHKLKLGIDDKLKGPFSFMELCAAQLAEDIQLEKVAVKEDLSQLLSDEVRRTTLFYEETYPPLPIARWNALPHGAKLNMMTSVTWTYSVESWFGQVLNETAAKSQVSKNLKLVYPHYSKHGYAPLKDLILRLFNEPLAKTEKESNMMFRRILAVLDQYADSHNLLLC